MSLLHTIARDRRANELNHFDVNNAEENVNPIELENEGNNNEFHNDPKTGKYQNAHLIILNKDCCLLNLTRIQLLPPDFITIPDHNYKCHFDPCTYCKILKINLHQISS